MNSMNSIQLSQIVCYFLAQQISRFFKNSGFTDFKTWDSGRRK